MRIAVSAIALVVFGLFAAPAFTSAQSSGIPAGASVYIENMDAQFEVDFRKEFIRQKVALNVVSSREEAQIIVAGAEEATSANFTTPQPGTMTFRIRRGGTVTVQDKANNKTLWSGKWEVRSLNPKDEQKAASDLVGKLKKAVRSKR